MPLPSSARAERDYELLLDQVTPATLLPLLRTSCSGFPAKSRALIWSRLLHLPRDRKKFSLLSSSLPSPSPSVEDALLACWPALSSLPFLPIFLQPVLELFSGHPTTSFEASLVLVRDFLLLGQPPSPAPGQAVLQLAREMLEQEQPATAQHLAQLGCSDRQLFWPLLSSGWAAVLPSSDWATVWDHLVTAGPHLLVCLLAATLASLSSTLLSCTSSWMVTNLLNSCLALHLPSLLSTAHHLLEQHGARLVSLLPLPRPVFSGGDYPTLQGRRRRVLGDLKDNNQEPGSYREEQAGYKEVVLAALRISPPPVPRLATNRPKEQEVAAPLKPPLAPTYLLEEDGVEGDLTALLRKAKLLRMGVMGK